jgi:uncharacterized membrane protein YgdD (TMEM256/DUF423 family)
VSWIVIGAVSGFLAVAFGAFGAHGLAETLDAKALAVYQTAAQYQMYHSLALIGLGAWSARQPEASIAVAGAAFSVGIVVFSGSLYALALTGIKWLGAVTPVGGLAFLVGWAAFAIQAWRSAR